MTLQLTQEKVTELIQQCQTFLSRYKVLARETSQLIEKLSYSATAVHPAQL